MYMYLVILFLQQYLLIECDFDNHFDTQSYEYGIML